MPSSAGRPTGPAPGAPRLRARTGPACRPVPRFAMTARSVSRPRRLARRTPLPVGAREVPAGWVVGLGGSGADRALGVAADAAGNTYVTGTFSGTVDFDPGPAAVSLT